MASVEIKVPPGIAPGQNFICNIGYADISKMYRKFDRFDFDEVCEVL